MKKHLPTITIFFIIIGIIALGIWYSDKNSPIKQLAKLDLYSKDELSFLEKEGFLDVLEPGEGPKTKEQIISLLKSPTLIEQNLNSPDESFEVLATKLDENTYQLAFKLENKSNQSKEFYLIPISESSQTEFKEIKGNKVKGDPLSVKDGEQVSNNSLSELYDVEKHKKQLRPELAQAYDDIDNNGYTGKPIKLILEANSTLLARSRWEIRRGPTSGQLEPVYLLVYGSAGGVKDELTILNVHSHPQKGENWEVEFTTRGVADLRIIPADQATIDDDEFTGLFCDNQRRTPQILENDIIYYPNWQCLGTGKVVHYTKKAGNHALRFEFGGKVAYAYNDPGPSIKFGGASAGVGAAAWYHPKWLYRKKITIQNANVDGDLTDFPLYVDITSDADIGGNAQADGDDIRFTTDDGITVMPHEEESFTVSAGSATGHFWVKIPTVNNASTTDIYIYYGNSDAGDGQQVTAVWDSSFKMVQHMQEDPSGAAPQIIDSTDNNNDGTSEGSMTSGDQVSTGKVNGALDLDGSDDRINFGNDSTLNFNSMASYTLGYWISLDTVSPEFQTLLNKGWKVQFYVNYNDLRMVHNVGGGDVVRAVYPNMSTATWYRIVAVWNGTWIDFYVNGTKYVGGNIGTPDATSSNVLVGYTSVAYPRAVNGRIDEVRITNDVRTANEIKFEYYNMNEADNELDNFAAQETYSAPSFIRMKGGIIFK